MLLGAHSLAWHIGHAPWWDKLVLILCLAALVVAAILGFFQHVNGDRPPERVRD